MKKFLVYSLFVFLSVSLVGAQCIGSCTSVTATLTDGAGQLWTNATITINIVKPFGNPGQILNNGVPINSPNNTVLTDLTGTFTISLDDNNVLTPKGTSWSFTLCPNATTQNCSQSTQFITGTSLNLTTVLSTILISPIVNAAPTISRAYNDTEALGGQGSVYWRTTDNTLRGCFGAPCPSSWIPIGSGGGGGGSGTVNNGNLNFIPKYVTNPNGTVLGPDTNLDDGATVANTFTYKGSGGFNLPSDGIHTGSVQIGGNTTLPPFNSNAFGWLGPNSASFTSYFLQPSATGPSNATPFMSCGTPVSNVSPCTFVAGTSGGITCGTTCTTGWLTEFTSSTGIGNSVYQDQGSQGTYGLVSDTNASQRQEFNSGFAIFGSTNYSTNSGFNPTNGESTRMQNVWKNTNCVATNAWCYVASIRADVGGLTSSITTNELTGLNTYAITANLGGTATSIGTLSAIRANASYGSGNITSINNSYGIFATVGCSNSNPTTGVLCPSNTDNNPTLNQAAGAFMAGTGNTTQSEAIYASLNFPTSSSPQIATNTYGILIDSPLFGTNITASHLYGIFIKDQTLSGTGTNSDPWGIFEAGTAKNQFGGIVNHVAGIQQNSTALALQCGTTTTCANTAVPLAHMVFGDAPLVSGTPSTAAVTGISPAFTSTSTYECTVSNNTTQANPIKVTKVSGSAVTFTGPTTVTDVISYICVGN